MLSTSNCKIGGKNVVVEIDETKLGKRKYNRGHQVEEVCCICGIERSAGKRCFVIPVENRNSETIYQILKNNVEEGSIIYTDCWKAYNKPCEDLNFTHHTVNHSKFFKDPNTGLHTNTVEGSTMHLKQ